MIRFLHTADLQLGMPFHWVPGDRGAQLRGWRFEAIDRCVDLAASEDAAFILVAGDVFDANTVDDRTVIQACTRFGRSKVPVIAIPGNHDHGGPGSVWRRRSFLDHRPENFTVLEGREPMVVAGGRAVLLPAPLNHRQERGDTTAHWTPEFGRSLAPDAVRIGLAHGSVQDFTGEAMNHIDPQRADRADLDYLALGDWHGSKEVGRKTWYAGTPEPTRFIDNDAGNALIVSAGRATAPRVTRVPVARGHWIRHSAHLDGGEDIHALGSWFDQLSDPLTTLVRLEISGMLSFSDMEALDLLLKSWEDRLVLLRRKDAALVPVGREEELEAIATRGYVANAIASLKASVAQGGERGATAARALRLLYRLHVGGQQGREVSP